MPCWFFHHDILMRNEKEQIEKLNFVAFAGIRNRWAWSFWMGDLNCGSGSWWSFGRMAGVGVGVVVCAGLDMILDERIARLGF